MPAAKPTERGIVYRRGRERFLLAWSRVQRAFAGEVGAPGDPPSVVFDLAVVTRGSECVICRTSTAPGGAAVRLARAVQLGIAGEVDPSIAAVAEAGGAARRHADLDAWTDAVLEAVRFTQQEPGRPIG